MILSLCCILQLSLDVTCQYVSIYSWFFWGNYFVTMLYFTAESGRHLSICFNLQLILLGECFCHYVVFYSWVSTSPVNMFQFTAILYAACQKVVFCEWSDRKKVKPDVIRRNRKDWKKQKWEGNDPWKSFPFVSKSQSHAETYVAPL
jgi:hypothetical protein